MNFIDAIRDAEEEQVVATCRELFLGPDEIAQVLHRHRRSRYLLDLVLVHGGTVRDYVRMKLEVIRCEPIQFATPWWFDDPGLFFDPD